MPTIEKEVAFQYRNTLTNLTWHQWHRNLHNWLTFFVSVFSFVLFLCLLLFCCCTKIGLEKDCLILIRVVSTLIDTQFIILSLNFKQFSWTYDLHHYAAYLISSEKSNVLACK